MADYDQEGTTLIHIAGPYLQYLSLLRQRCSWCGFIIVDDDFSRMAVAVTTEDPHPQPARGFPFEAFIEVTVAAGGSFRYFSVVDVGEEPDGSIKVPENSCMRVPPELTGR